MTRHVGAGMADQKSETLQADHALDHRIDAGEKYGFTTSVAAGPTSQGKRQVEAARGRSVDWHAAERRALRFFEKVIPTRDRIGFVYTPAK